MSELRRLSFVTIFILGAATACVAQKSYSLVGSILDNVGDMIAGATVRVIGQGLDISTVSDSEGQFHVNVPSRGDYEITVQHSLFRANRKKVTVTTHSREVIHFRMNPRSPCGDEPISRNRIRASDRVQITRKLVDLVLNGDYKSGSSTAEIIFVRTNFRFDWLTKQQRARVAIMDRKHIQHLADKEGEVRYLYVRPIQNHGSCVAAEMWVTIAVKGQAADANLGGGVIYEFSKKSGQWQEKWFRAWVN